MSSNEAGILLLAGFLVWAVLFSLFVGVLCAISEQSAALGVILGFVGCFIFAGVATLGIVWMRGFV